MATHAADHVRYSMDPALPQKPQTANPRNRNLVPSRRVPMSARGISTSPFLDQVDDFLSRELDLAHSDSDIVYVYQRAFDSLANEFETCRPLLERIKQQYDTVARQLLSRKRTMATDCSSVSAAEDSFSEMVNKMRRARNQEFARRSQETDKLLDEMTQLRLTKLELTKELEALQAQRNELRDVEQNHRDQMANASNRVHELIDEIKQMDADESYARRNIVTLEDKLEKTVISSQDLKQSESALSGELERLRDKEVELAKELEEIKQKNEKAGVDLQDVSKDLLGVTRENTDAQEKLRGIKERKENQLTTMRAMLNVVEKDENVSVREILERLLAK